MKVCFDKLGIDQDSVGSKRAKKDKKNNKDKEEALQVLFDFLISLLTKKHSFLRDIANFVFKQFCHDISMASLNNMIEIISTPN